MGKIKILINLIKRAIYSPTKYARSIGVNIGSNNILFSVGWSTEPYLITIGNDCQITKGVKIFTHGGSFVLRKELPDFDCFGKVIIKDNVYIGNNSLILPGVTIGNNVLIAAGSVVTKSIPDNVCVGGNPAKALCTLEEFKTNNLKYNVGSKGMDKKQKRALLLSLEEDKFIKKGLLN